MSVANLVYSRHSLLRAGHAVNGCVPSLWGTGRKIETNTLESRFSGKASSTTFGVKNRTGF